MKTIRFSITNLGGGGAEKILINILKYLPQDKYHISLFLFEKKGVYLEDIPKYVKLQYFMNPAKFTGYLQPLYDKLIRKIAFRMLMHYPRLVYKICGVQYFDIDVAFLQDTTYLMKVANANKKIAWLHTNIYRSPTFKNGLYENLLEVDKIICVSDGVKQKLNVAFPDLKSRSKVIYNPTDIRLINDLSLSNHVQFNGKTILAVGSLSAAKGFDILIRAIKVLFDRGYDYKLKIIGSGEEEHNLLTLILNLKLQTQVELLGFMDNPFSVVKAADLFVLSSRNEGLPGALLEALCLGIPVVSTDCEVGPREILQDGECGLLVPVGDVEKLADGIELLMTDIELREKFVVQGLKRAQDFDLPKIMTQIEALFDEI